MPSGQEVGWISALHEVLCQLGDILLAVIIKVSQLEVTLRNGVVLGTEASACGHVVLLLPVETGGLLNRFTGRLGR